MLIVADVRTRPPSGTGNTASEIRVYGKTLHDRDEQLSIYWLQPE